MTEVPAPLVPAEVDLRDFGFMPLDIIRLFGSRFHAIASDAEWRAGVTLWAKSFHQVPAASLPDDDVELCRLAELGRDVKTWKRLRANAMHGWVLCSDGRWYHPVVSEKANEAWSRKRVARERSAKGNAKRWGYRDDPSHESGRIEGSSEECKNDPSSLQEGSHKESLKDRKGQGQGQGQGQGIKREDIPPSAGAAAPPGPPPTDRDLVFANGVVLLTVAGVSDRNARSFLAAQCKAHGEAAVRLALERCAEERPGEPVSWLQAALKAQRTGSPRRNGAMTEAERNAANAEANAEAKRLLGITDGHTPKPVETIDA